MATLAFQATRWSVKPGAAVLALAHVLSQASTYLLSLSFASLPLVVGVRVVSKADPVIPNRPEAMGPSAQFSSSAEDPHGGAGAMRSWPKQLV